MHQLLYEVVYKDFEQPQVDRSRAASCEDSQSLVGFLLNCHEVQDTVLPSNGGLNILWVNDTLDPFKSKAVQTFDANRPLHLVVLERFLKYNQQI